jgi:3-hydroxymyristoyl/3-hydroxydecanoyl-(acyl carrier protein) dehydratase
MRGAGPLSLALAVEILAQASHVLLSAGGEGVFLAGIEDASLTREIRAGDRLAARAEVEGTFGPLTKVRATLEDGDGVVAEAGLLLASR